MGFTSLKNELKGCSAQSAAVAWGLDGGVLRALQKALQWGFLGEVVVTGPQEEIRNLAEKENVSLAPFTIIAAATPDQAAAAAVRLIKEGRCSILMKGNLSTGSLLRAVLHKEQGIRAQALLSHIALIELPQPRLALLTDAGMNIRPDLNQKAQILDNAIQCAWSLGIAYPKVAVLAAVETVNARMPETIEAAALTLMGKRGQFSKPALVDGPLAFDNAYCLKAAQQKEIRSEVAGRADILMVPEIVAGNILYKAFNYLGFLPTTGLIYGADCPIVLTSRADSEESKLNGIAAACQALNSR